MSSMMVSISEHASSFDLRNRHIMGIVGDDEYAVAEAMWGGDINWTPKVT
jgi:hypothetical protein